MKISLPRPVYDANPEWVGLHDLAWKIALANVEHPTARPWKPQMCCMPDIGIIWAWDSCFMTFFTRYSNGLAPGMNNLDNIYRLQDEDGFIGMAYMIDSGKLAYGTRINPPLFAWSELAYWKQSGDDERIKNVLPRLVRFFDWIQTNRRRKSGLYWFEDSGSTGMDNSPRSGYAAESLNGSDVCHVDLAAQQALSAECMAIMARHVGEDELARRFDEEHRQIVALLNRHHWDPKTGFYYDVFSRSFPTEKHNYLNHKTVAGFWPMIAGCCDEQQVEALIEHLLNPDEFWTPHPVASLSKDDPNYDASGAYWLGGVWAPINYMIAKALQRQGRPDLSKRVATAHLRAMHAVSQSPDYPGIWEAYAPESFVPATKKKPALDPSKRHTFTLNADTVVRPNFVGWSGLGPIAMLIEDVFGLDFDGVRKQVTWTLQTAGNHGIHDLHFNGGIVSLQSNGLMEARKDIVVEVTTDVDFRLVLTLAGSDRHESTLNPGHHVLRPWMD